MNQASIEIKRDIIILKNQPLPHMQLKSALCHKRGIFKLFVLQSKVEKTRYLADYQVHQLSLLVDHIPYMDIMELNMQVAHMVHRKMN